MNASTRPRQATEAELRDHCGHLCLKDSGHVERGEPHFYGYLGGPWSMDGMGRQIDDLRAEVERLRDGIRQHHQPTQVYGPGAVRIGCSTCMAEGSDWADWPCPTASLLETKC